MNRIVILQPSYLPWLGYFDQMVRADTFVFLDDVQFTRRDWRNRNKIRTRQGWTWLTVPILQKGNFNQSLLETKIDNTIPWRKKHLNSIRTHYAKTPFFDLYFYAFESIINKGHEKLVDLSLEIILWLKDIIGIDTPTLRSSELNIEGVKKKRILSICQQLSATHYLSGEVGEDYLAGLDFLRYNITLEYQHYQHMLQLVCLYHLLTYQALSEN